MRTGFWRVSCLTWITVACILLGEVAIPTTSRAAAAAPNYCCVCAVQGTGICDNCDHACSIVTDATACDTFCANQFCPQSDPCAQSTGGCGTNGDGCGSGAGRACSPTFQNRCCDPSVPGSVCAPTATATRTVTQTPTATVTGTVTQTATQTATSTATSSETATGTVTATATNTRVPQGGACTSPSQCITGFCVDDVCCDRACTAPLEQCNLPGQVGTCATAAAQAPALTLWGLVAGLLTLAAVAASAVRRRIRRA